MTITYPRPMPSEDFSESDFQLVRNQAVNRAMSGQIQATELADPYWSFKATTKPLYRQDRQKWQAWSASLKGAMMRFTAFDPERIYPAFYGASVLGLTRAGGGSFNGTCSLNSVSAFSISLLNLPAGFHILVGDTISIVLNSGIRTLHLATEECVCDGTGKGVVSVEPSVRVNEVSAQATVQLVRASCSMLLVPGRFSAPAGFLAPVSFEAVQALA